MWMEVNKNLKHLMLYVFMCLSALLVVLSGSCSGKEKAFLTSPVATAQMLSHTETLTPPPIEIEPGFGGVRGRLIAYPSTWKNREIFAYFAIFVPVEREDQGFYYLEPSEHPHVKVLENGWLQTGKVPPGLYVIVIGPTPQEALPIRDGEQPRIVKVEKGKLVDLGEIYLQ